MDLTDKQRELLEAIELRLQQEDHLKRVDPQCPQCSSKQLKYHSPIVAIQGGAPRHAIQTMSCLNCNFAWQDEWQVVSFTPVLRSTLL